MARYAHETGETTATLLGIIYPLFSIVTDDGTAEYFDDHYFGRHSHESFEIDDKRTVRVVDVYGYPFLYSSDRGRICSSDHVRML